MVSQLKGYLDYVGFEQVIGWCSTSETSEPLVMALYINNKEVATTVANLPRPDVCLQGVHPTGECGFKFDIDKACPLNPGDNISVKAIINGTLLELENSPQTLCLNKSSSDGNPLSRREKIFTIINPQGYGLEISSSINLLAPKSLGYNCKVLNHLNADELRKKYAADSRVSNIEEVDYIRHGEPLPQLMDDRKCFDYIIASDVIEHTPDLLGFLQDCESLLKETGTLSLVIPDKRYCFDFFRGPSTTGDVLQAHLEKRTLHSPGVVFDYFSDVCAYNEQIAWPEFRFNNTLETAAKQMEKALSKTDYIDVHHWIFTPSSFRLILADLLAMKKIHLKETCFYETVGGEFFMSLQFEKSANTPPVDRLSLLKQSFVEVMESVNNV